MNRKIKRGDMYYADLTQHMRQNISSSERLEYPLEYIERVKIR